MVFRITLFTLITLLSACGGGSNVKNTTNDIRLGSEPIEPPEGLARIYINSYKKNPNNVLFVLWQTQLTAVDGMPILKNGQILQLPPGMHTLQIKYSIESDPNSNNPSSKGTCNLDYKLEQGKLYSINNISVTSIGRCSARITEVRPTRL